MKKYVVIGSVARFNTGEKIGLSAEQYALRQHALEIVEEKDGLKIACVKTQVEFKNGEAVFISSEPNKLLLQEIKEADAADLKRAPPNRQQSRKRRHCRRRKNDRPV